jgi:hypothetical protein
LGTLFGPIQVCAGSPLRKPGGKRKIRTVLHFQGPSNLGKRCTSCLIAAILTLAVIASADASISHGRIVGSLIVSGAAKRPGRCGCSYEPGIVVIIGKRGDRHRIRVGRSGRFSLPFPVGRYHALGGIPRLGWEFGACYVDSPRPPSWIHVTANRTSRIVVDCHGH